MKNRREALIGLAAGVTAASLPVASRQAQAGEETACDCCSSAKRTQDGKIFPNVPVVTHDNERAVFYNDLIRHRTVLLNFMSIVGDRTYPVTENLVKVQQLLGERLGRDFFMYSVTVDPENDTPAALKKFAAQYGVGAGWKFLTGDPKALGLIHNSFFIHSAGHHQHQQHGPDCSMGIARYGNDAVGTWGSVASKSSPQWIAERLLWVQRRKVPAGRPKRKGPRPRNSSVAAKSG